MEATFDQTLKFARKALDLMEKRSIRPVPHHYAVWYDYVACKDFSLVEEIDRAAKEAVRFDDGLNEYLYEKYVAAREQEDEAQVTARKLLSNILQTLSECGGEAKEYQQRIDDHISDLEKSGDAGDLQTMVAKIIDTAKALRQSSEQMHKKLEDSRAEVEHLKQTVVQATNEAQRDFLTGVFNRKALDKMLDELAALSNAQKTPLTLLMLDVDHFKKFNDTHGHLIGDEVLKTIAKALTDTLKGKDIVARFGGEEFCVLLPSTAFEHALIVAESLRKTIAEKELTRRDTGQKFGAITVSIGVAAYRPGQDTIPVFIKRADEALYEAKRRGRNRVIGEAKKAA